MAQAKIAKRVKLWNDTNTDYKEIVLGNEVFIPARGFVTLSRREAITVRGHCCGRHKPVTLRMEPIEETTEERKVYINHQTGVEYPTEEALYKSMGIDAKSIEAAKTAKRYICPFCDDAEFTTKDALIRHQTKCAQKYQLAPTGTATTGKAAKE